MIPLLGPWEPATKTNSVGAVWRRATAHGLSITPLWAYPSGSGWAAVCHPYEPWAGKHPSHSRHDTMEEAMVAADSRAVDQGWTLP